MIMNYSSFERWRAHTIQLGYIVRCVRRNRWEAVDGDKLVGYFNQLHRRGQLDVGDRAKELS